MESTHVRFLAAWARVCFAIQFILPLLVVAAGIKSGFRFTWDFPNRIMILLALTIFVYGLQLLPHFMEPITGHRIDCNSDDTTATDTDLRRSSLAMFGFAMHVFGEAVHRLVFLFISFIWWQLVLKLQTGRAEHWYVINVRGLFEVVGLSVIIVWGIVVTSLQSRGNLGVNLVVHVCFSVNGQSEWLLIGPNIAATFLSFVLMIDGCRRLVCLHLHSNRNRRKMFSDEDLASSHSSPGSSVRRTVLLTRARTPESTLPRNGNDTGPPTGRESRMDKAMYRLLVRFFLFLMGLLLAGSTGHVLLVILVLTTGTHKLDFAEGSPRPEVNYAECRIASCGQDPACDVLRSSPSARWLNFQILFYTMNIINAVLMCAGVFSPRSWRKHLSSKEKKRERKRAMIRRRNRADRCYFPLNWYRLPRQLTSSVLCQKRRR